jgi:hypothetical protein
MAPTTAKSGSAVRQRTQRQAKHSSDSLTRSCTPFKEGNFRLTCHYGYTVTG